MGLVASTFTFGTSGRGAFSGHVYRIVPSSAAAWAKKRIYLPPSCSAIEAKPSVQNYLQRQYLVGQHTMNILIDEELRAVRQGITVPPIPDVSAGAGTTQQRCYLRYYDEWTGEKSSVGLGKDLTGSVTRTWINLPTSVPSEALIVEGTVNIAAGTVTGLLGKTNFGILRPGDRIAVSTALTRWAQVRTITAEDSMTIDDTGMAGAGVSIVVKPVSRVSHVEEWISVAGGLPRFGTRLRLGTTGNVESIATLALGEALVDSYQPMPTGGINLVYNDRQFVAQVQGHLDTVYLSEIGFLERWAGLAFKTSYGEPIVGLFRYRDVVLMLCPSSSYKLQGYTEDDYVRNVLEPDIGALGHSGNILVEGVALIPSRNGMQIFNGAFHPAIETRRTEWIEDYRENPTAFEGGYAAVNPNDQSYFFFPNVQRIAVSSDEVPAIGLDIGGACAEVGLGSSTDVAAINGKRLYGVIPTTNDAADGATGGFHYYTSRQYPKIRRVPYDATSHNDRICTAFIEGVLWIAGRSQTLNLIYLKKMVRGSLPVTVATIAYPVGYDATTPFFPVSIEQYAGDIYINAGNSTVSAESRTYKYSLGALTIDDTGVKGELRAIGDSLYLLATPIRRKNAGVWANIGGTTGGTGSCVFNNAIFYCQGTNIRKIVGVTATIEHTNGARTFHRLCVYDSQLYYINQASDYFIGQSDGAAAYNDSVKNITTQFIFLSANNYFIGELDGNLYVVLDDVVNPCNFHILSSPGTTVNGAWVQQANFDQTVITIANQWAVM